MKLSALEGLTPFQTIVVLGRDACAKPDAKGVATEDATHIKCSKTDAAALGAAQDALRDTFASRTLVGLTDMRMAPLAFFTSGARITCKAPASDLVAAKPDTQGDTGDPKSLDYWSFSNFRVRGGASDMIIAHGGSSYDDVDKAKLTFGSEDGKSSKTLVGAVGYALPVVAGSRNPATGIYTNGSIVPFFGVDLEESRKKGVAKEVKSDTITIGAAFQYQRTFPIDRKDVGNSDWASWYFGATPQVRINYEDDSQVIGLNLLYRPAGVIAGLSVNKNDRIGNSYLSWRTIFDMRLNSGIFSRRGSRTLDDSRDFSRFGGRIGIGFSSFGKFAIPIDVTFTDTYMIALTGKPDHLSLLKGSATVYLNEDKIFGIELSYDRGRLEDLDSHDNKWSFGFVAKY
jgi:hypothetical protein